MLGWALLAGGALFATSELRGDVSLGIVLKNFREEVPGRLYGAGQLSGPQLREVVERFGIRTVINLRGYDTSAPWYREEKAVARELGVAHHDVHLSARSLPRKEELLRLLDLYASEAAPVLVHCESGADRTGEAVALYRVEVLGEAPGAALKGLSIWRRHWSWRKPEKRAFVAQYRGRRWLEHEYDPCDGSLGSHLREPSTCPIR